LLADPRSMQLQGIYMFSDTKKGPPFMLDTDWNGTFMLKN